MLALDGDPLSSSDDLNGTMLGLEQLSRLPCSRVIDMRGAIDPITLAQLLRHIVNLAVGAETCIKARQPLVGNGAHLTRRQVFEREHRCLGVAVEQLRAIGVELRKVGTRVDQHTSAGHGH